MSVNSSTIYNSNNFEQEFVQIPAGVIELRDDRTKNKWLVGVDEFLLSRFLVTQELYFEVTKENPSLNRGNSLPVETVSFKEAAVFCNKISDRFNLDHCYKIDNVADEILFEKNASGFRLPTEAEWEYACKAGTTANRYGELDQISWYKNNSNNQTHPVGQKLANKWGLYDMLGNVWEWCSDIYDSNVYGTYRIFRGGGFCDEERSVMATTRRRSHPTKFKIEDLGFRVARNKTN